MKLKRIKYDNESKENLKIKFEKILYIQNKYLNVIEKEIVYETFIIEKGNFVKRMPYFIERNNIITTIKDFWSSVILSCDELITLINDNDLKLLKYLKDVIVDYVDNGINLVFLFCENEIIKDKQLIKNVTYRKNGDVFFSHSGVKWKKKFKKDNKTKVGEKRKHDEIVKGFFTFFENSDNIENDLTIFYTIKNDVYCNPKFDS